MESSRDSRCRRGRDEVECTAWSRCGEVEGAAVGTVDAAVYPVWETDEDVDVLVVAGRGDE